MAVSSSVLSIGLQLYVEQNTAVAQEKGQVLIIHGVGEHLGRHQWLAEALAKAGYAVTRFDLHGFGRSEGLQGHVERFSDYFSDIRSVLAATGLTQPYIFGQSMGGLIAAAYALAYPASVQGLVLSSPCLGLQMKPQPWKETLAKLLSHTAPRIRMKNDLPLEGLAHDPAVAHAYDTDPLCYRKVSPRWYTELLRTMAQVHADAGKLSCPLLVLAGQDDPIVNTAATETFFSHVNNADKTLRVFPDTFHEVLNESCKDTALALIVEWLDQHR